MKDIKIGDPIAITLPAAEWFWIAGVLQASGITDDDSTLAKLYEQIVAATE